MSEQFTVSIQLVWSELKTVSYYLNQCFTVLVIMYKLIFFVFLLPPQNCSLELVVIKMVTTYRGKEENCFSEQSLAKYILVNKKKTTPNHTQANLFQKYKQDSKIHKSFWEQLRCYVIFALRKLFTFQKMSGCIQLGDII